MIVPVLAAVVQQTSGGIHPVWAIPGAVLAAATVVLPAWWAHRRAMRGISDTKDQVADVAKSVGQVNGHGTVQDATGAQLDQGVQILSELAEMRRTQHSMQTGIDAVVEAASTVNQRLKANDREHHDMKRRLDRLDGGD